MENENVIPESVPEMDILEREERCRKAIKTVGRAIFMRLFVSVLLIWAACQTTMELWIIGLLGLVILINLSGMLPLVKELKKRRLELQEILAEDE